MPTTLLILLILCVLIWLPVVFHQISHRGFLILLIWLLIAPVATNLVRGDTNPFFSIHTESGPTRIERHLERMGDVTQDIEDVGWRKFLEPTRLLFYSFFLVFVLGTLLRKTSVLPLDRTEVLMGVFSLMLIGNILFLSDRLFYSIRIASDAFMVPFCAYYVARRFVVNEGRLRQIMQILGYLGCSLIIIVLIERLANHGLLYRVRGPFGTVIALYFVIVVVFFTALFDSVHVNPSQEKRNLSAGVRWFVLCLVPVIILLTWYRAHWVGFLSGLWIVLFLGQRLTIRSQKFATIGLALILVAGIGIGLSALTPEKVMEGRITTTETVDWRYERWTIAIQEGKNSPVFGIGFNNLRELYAAKLGTYRSTHNVYLALFAEGGALMLLGYLAIIGSMMGIGLRLYRTGGHPRDRWRGITLIAVIAALMIPGLMESTVENVGVWNIYMYVLVGGVSGLNAKRGLVASLKQFPRVLEQERTQVRVQA